MEKEEFTDNKLLHQLAAYCTRSERSPRQVSQWLIRHRVDKMHHKYYTKRLQELDFLSPERFAAAFFADKSRFSGWGEYKIRHHLLEHGLSVELVEKTLEDVAESREEVERTLTHLLQNKLSLIKAKNDGERKCKLIRFGIGRGFAPELVIQVADTLLSSYEEYE